MITLFLDSGIGELRSIKISDLDFNHMRVKISGKTGSREAMFSEKCKDAIATYLKMRKAQDEGDGPLWYSEDKYPLIPSPDK